MMKTHFDTAWGLVKAPVYFHEEEPDWEVESGNADTWNPEIPISVHGPMYQGRRAGMEDTGYWTPHKDKALAYAMYGSDYRGEKWGGKPPIDARKAIPELYKLNVPDDVKQLMQVDHSYMNQDDNNWGNALTDRRVSGYTPPLHQNPPPPDESKTWKKRMYEHNIQPYMIDSQHISKIPDLDVADMIEAVNRGIYTEEDFMDTFGLSNRGLENIYFHDYPSDRALSAELTMDTGTTGGRVAPGSTIMDYVQALRGRGQ